MKKIIKIIAIILIALVALSFTKNMIAKRSVSAAVKAMTGLKLSMKSMDVGIFKTLIGIRGLKLFNPRGFPDKLMADMPEIYVDYDLGAFLKGKAHLEELRLNLKEFVVVKNKEGELNLDSLKVVQAKKEREAPQEKKKAKMPELQIDVLKLKIGKVIYKDYSAGTPPSVREFDVNIDERHENITDLHALASLIMVKALAYTTIASLADFDVRALEEEGATVLKKAKETAKEAFEKTTEAIKRIFKSGEGE